MCRYNHWGRSLVLSICIVSISLATQPQQGEFGGGELYSNQSPCLTQADHDHAAACVTMYEENFGPISSNQLFAPLLAPDLFTFYPMGGRFNKDNFVTNFVDLNSGPGILDYTCNNITYDGHDAQDVALRSFGEQLVGVPIFAALDGTVIGTQDGYDDMNTQALGQPSNYVIIDHGNGRVCYYWHMRKNSVAVSVGQQVKAGEQIGLVGSSGNSTGPHLHFATYDNGNVFEPFAGPCRSGSSGFALQPTFNSSLYVYDFGVNNSTLNGFTPPFEFPREVQIMYNENPAYFWMILPQLPAFSNWQIQLRRPNNTIATTFGNSFGNPNEYHWSWWWFSVNHNANLSMLGEWDFVFYVNGQKIIDAPFIMTNNFNPNFNRPPNPITVAFDPAMPTSNDVLTCNVNTSLIYDDPDYDLLSYIYVWKVNGVIVRQIESAAHSDMLACQTASPGDTITCEVTPSDGTSQGPMASVTALANCPYSLLGDIDQNCKVDLNDFVSLSDLWLDINAPCPPADWPEDLNNDCIVNVEDLKLLISNWLTNCLATPGHPSCIEL